MSASDTRRTLITAWQGYRKLTDDKAAGLVGVSRRTWCEWKKGGFDISVSQLTELCIRMRMPKEDTFKVLLADYPAK